MKNKKNVARIKRKVQVKNNNLLCQRPMPKEKQEKENYSEHKKKINKKDFPKNKKLKIKREKRKTNRKRKKFKINVGKTGSCFLFLFPLFRFSRINLCVWQSIYTMFHLCIFHFVLYLCTTCITGSSMWENMLFFLVLNVCSKQ